MRILYVASDVDPERPDGGAVHVRELAAGLAALGHEVRAVVKGRPGAPRRAREAGVELRRTLARAPSRWLRLGALPAVLAEARDLRPDVVIERYYNFGGEGMLAARRRSIPYVLEVNSPMVEYEGSPKERLDRLVGSPLRRWRERMARAAAAFVTPSPAILPPGTPASKVHVLAWGANTDLFRPDVAPVAIDLPADRGVVAFVASFRHWHGAGLLVRVAEHLRRTGAPVPLFLMIGDGPERPAIEARAKAAGLAEAFRFTGAVPYERIPSLLRRASIGVAPFEIAAHPYLKIDFYWCPLKVLEYMAMALPVVTIDVPALAKIVRPGIEGRLVPEGDAAALAAALRALLENPEEARRLGAAARERAVERFSWRAHCAAVGGILERVTGGEKRPA